MDTTDIAILGSLILCFCIQVFYFLYFYIKPFSYNKKQKKDISTIPEESLPGVSVIITAKNEYQNLSQFLPLVLEQDYPDFEVIVINDGSTDESEDVLIELSHKYKNLYKTYIPEEAKYLSRKKLALTVGIKAAKNDILLITEANCEPLSKNWIKTMASNYSNGTDIVLGFSKFNRWGFCSRLAGYDNLLSALRYFSCAIRKHPYMGVGSNLSYRKNLFFSIKGFAKRMHLQSGDDDLFVNDTATRTNTKVELSEDSVTQTNIDSFKIWKEMKLCRTTTQKFYKGHEVAMWRFENITRFLYWGLTIFSCIYYWNTIYIPIAATCLFLVKFVIHYFVINKSAKMFHVKRFYVSLVFYDLLQPLFNLYIAICRLFRGKLDYTWSLK